MLQGGFYRVSSENNTTVWDRIHPAKDEENETCAALIRPFITAQVQDYLSLVGSILIFCIGLNLVWDMKIRVSNMLPAIVIAVIAAVI